VVLGECGDRRFKLHADVHVGLHPFVRLRETSGDLLERAGEPQPYPGGGERLAVAPDLSRRRLHNLLGGVEVRAEGGVRIRRHGLFRKLDALDRRHGRLQRAVVQLPGKLSPGALLSLHKVGDVAFFQLLLLERLRCEPFDDGGERLQLGDRPVVETDGAFLPPPDVPQAFRDSPQRHGEPVPEEEHADENDCRSCHRGENPGLPDAGQRGEEVRPGDCREDDVPAVERSHDDVVALALRVEDLAGFLFGCGSFPEGEQTFRTGRRGDDPPFARDHEEPSRLGALQRGVGGEHPEPHHPRSSVALRLASASGERGGVGEVLGEVEDVRAHHRIHRGLLRPEGVEGDEEVPGGEERHRPHQQQKEVLLHRDSPLPSMNRSWSSRTTPLLRASRMASVLFFAPSFA